MVTPKKIIIKDLELADEEIVRLRKENKELKAYKSLYILLKERRDRQIEIEKKLRLKKNKLKKEDIILICFIVVMTAFTIYLGYLKNKSYVEWYNYCVERYKEF